MTVRDQRAPSLHQHRPDDREAEPRGPPVMRPRFSEGRALHILTAAAADRIMRSPAE